MNIVPKISTHQFFPGDRHQRPHTMTSIDDIPKEILIHILSFAPIQTAVRSTTIARKWRNIWKDMPVINIDFDHMASHDPLIGKYIEFLTTMIHHRPSHFPLKKFKLHFGFLSRIFQSWVKYALLCEVEELNLVFTNKCHVEIWFGTYFTHPDKVYFHDLLDCSIRVLRLNGFKLWLPDTMLSIHCVSIRELHLSECYWNDEGIKLLMATCVNLETLSLRRVHGLHKLSILSKKLKHFELIGFSNLMKEQTSVEICAPSLKSVKFHGVHAVKYDFGVAFSLVEADVVFPNRSWCDFACWTNVLQFLSGLERLTIQNMWTWLVFDPMEEFAAINCVKAWKPEGESYEILQHYRNRCDELILNEEVFSKWFVFHNLKHLELLTGYLWEDILGLEILLGKCPQLETMILVYSYKSCLVKKRLGRMNIALQIPRLREVKMKEYRGTKNESYVVHLLKEHGVVLEKVVAFPAEEDGTWRPPVTL